MRSIGLLLVILGFTIPGIPFVVELLAADNCLDLGGSYDFVRQECDLLQNHPFVPFWIRQIWLLVAGASVFLVGSGLLAVAGRRPGTAINTRSAQMTSDLDAIVRGVRAELPDVEWSQLSVKHEADDNGLWFFRVPDREYEVQIESPTGRVPFLIESNRNNDRRIAENIDDVIDTIVRILRD